MLQPSRVQVVQWLQHKVLNETVSGVVVFLFSILWMKVQIDFMLQLLRVQLGQWPLLSSWLPSPPPGPSDVGIFITESM